ncbi:hypothetical protein BH11ACT4_BH11ACT4_02680 [soil metagenome]
MTKGKGRRGGVIVAIVIVVMAIATCSVLLVLSSDKPGERALIGATVATAVGTLALAAMTFLLARATRDTVRHSDEQLVELKAQGVTLRDQAKAATKMAEEAEHARLVSQAEKVVAWEDSSRTRYIVVNGSSLPIYEVCISLGGAYGAADPYYKGAELNTMMVLLPPGTYSVDQVGRSGGRGGMHVQLAAAISFRDAAGKFWRRDATGQLVQTPGNPLAELEVELPVSTWKTPTPIP